MSRVHVYVACSVAFFRLSVFFRPPSFSGGPVPSHWTSRRKRERTWKKKIGKYTHEKLPYPLKK